MIKKALALALSVLAIVSISAKAGVIKQDTSRFKTAMYASLQKAATDTTPVPVLPAAPVLTSEQLIFKARLDSIQHEVPLTYNSYVQKYIDIYASRSKQIAKAIGLSKYYFPIFDKGFKQYNVPEEIKFLSIVESSLDPFAVSRSGAVGPWQFMFNTAKGYGLNMDEYIDERRDPVAASYAAANYLRNSFSVLGDWLLAIASYNCGEGAVTRAIKKAGNVYDFWAIREYLPEQTQNYVPAFIATTYIMNYYQKHGILPVAADISSSNDVLLIDKLVPLAAIAKAANIDVRQLALLNPVYKKEVVNGSPGRPKSLILPALDIASYPSVYEVLNNPIIFTDTVSLARADTVAPIKIAKAEKKKPAVKFLTYKVKAGDTLSAIAAKFDGTSVSDIKSHNRLRSSSLQPGMVLKINKG